MGGDTRLQALTACVSGPVTGELAPLGGMARRSRLRLLVSREVRETVSHRARPIAIVGVTVIDPATRSVDADTTVVHRS